MVTVESQSIYTANLSEPFCSYLETSWTMALASGLFDFTTIRRSDGLVLPCLRKQIGEKTPLCIAVTDDGTKLPLAVTNSGNPQRFTLLGNDFIDRFAQKLQEEADANGINSPFVAVSSLREVPLRKINHHVAYLEGKAEYLYSGIQVSESFFRTKEYVASCSSELSGLIQNFDESDLYNLVINCLESGTGCIQPRDIAYDVAVCSVSVPEPDEAVTILNKLSSLGDPEIYLEMVRGITDGASLVPFASFELFSSVIGQIPDMSYLPRVFTTSLENWGYLSTSKRAVVLESICELNFSIADLEPDSVCRLALMASTTECEIGESTLSAILDNLTEQNYRQVIIQVLDGVVTWDSYYSQPVITRIMGEFRRFSGDQELKNHIIKTLGYIDEPWTQKIVADLI